VGYTGDPQYLESGQMAKIVGVHGIGHQFGGPNTLRAEWLPGIQDGLSLVGWRVPMHEDFDCAFYGHHFRPEGKAAIAAPLDASDIRDEWERKLLELWWQESALIDPGVRGPTERTKISTPLVVQRALNALSHSRFFAGAAQQALIFNLKQLRRYFGDVGLRERVRESVVSAVGRDTTVIVAHSLGSIVAYEALCAHPEWSIKSFVTIGSPLGISNLIFESLDPAPTAGLGAWPGSVTYWFNIADAGDVVALVKELKTRFGHRVKDELVVNGANVHDATRYLTTKEAGHAIAAGL
jgi:hypothetical protein